MVISISQTADDDGVMTTISDGRNTTDERSSARLLHFVRCFRLTYEIDVCILVVDLGKKRGGFCFRYRAREALSGRIEGARRVFVEPWAV